MDNKKSKGLIAVVCILALLVVGLSSYIIYDKLNDNSSTKSNEKGANEQNSSQEIVDDNSDKSKSQKCTYEYTFDNHKYYVNTETYNNSNNEKDINYTIEVYDENHNFIMSKTDITSGYYDCKNQIEGMNVLNLKDSQNNEYLLINIYLTTAGVYMKNGNEYKKVIDLSDYIFTQWKEKNTNKEIDTFRIENNVIYTIENNCNDDLIPKEVKITINNGEYNREYTGRKGFDTFEGIAGKLC